MQATNSTNSTSPYPPAPEDIEDTRVYSGSITPIIREPARPASINISNGSIRARAVAIRRESSSLYWSAIRSSVHETLSKNTDGVN